MLKKLIILTITLLTCIFGAIAILQSHSFKEFALKKLNEYIVKTTNGSLKIDEIQIDFPFTVVLKNIIFDNIHIEKASASLSLRKLIYGQIKIKQLILEDFEILTKEKSEKQTLIDIPEMPDYFSSFKLNDLQIKRLKYQNYFVDISGIVFNDAKGTSLNLNLEIISNEFDKITTQITLKRHLKTLIAEILLTKESATFKTEVLLNPDFSLILKNISASYDPIVKLQGEQLKVNFDPFSVTGTLKGTLVNAEYNGVKTEGRAFFHAVFSKDILNIRVKSKNLKAFGCSCHQAFAKVSIKNLYNDPVINLNLKSQKVDQEISGVNYSLSDISLNTHFDLSKKEVPFQFTCAEEPNFQANIKASGKCEYKQDIITINLKHLSGRLLDKPLNLTKHFSLKLQEGDFELTPLVVSFGEAIIQLKGKKKNDSGNIEILLNHLPASFLTNVADSGYLDADIKLTGALTNPSGKILLIFNDLKLKKESFSKVSLLQAELSIDIQNSNWQVTGSIKELKQNPIFVQASLPVSLSLFPFSYKLDNNAPLSAKFSLIGYLAPLVELFKTSASNLTGQTAITIDVTGSLNKPHVQGLAEIIDGTFEIPETGVLYKNIHANLICNDRAVKVTALTATDAFQGLIRGYGNVDLNIEKEFPFDFNIEIEKTNLLRLDYATATGNGHLKLTGDLKSATLEGKVLAEDVKVRIPEESPILVQSVDVVYINRDESKYPLNNYSPASVWPITLNLEFDVKEPFSIKGTDLKSRWAGSLKIKGTAETPEIFGEFKVVDGQYKFNGKIFEINEGSISFSGEPGKKTSLYVIGSQDLGQIKADVILKGPLKSPAISFRSNPPLPQREILSWILFGHGASELNTFQGSKLNQSITNLNKGGSKGPDLLTKIRNKIGIDTIDFNHNDSDSNEVSIKVGKYVSKGILVSVKKSISAEANRLEIEAKVIKNIKVQAEIGDDAEGQLNLKWKTDY